MSEQERRERNAARMELRRLVSDGVGPSETPPATFGEWGECIEELRKAHARGTGAVRDLFVTLARMTPAVGVLLSSDPEPEQTGWDLDDLLLIEFPPPEWIVPDLLPAGLGLLAGRPKLGKSWLAFQIALAVGKGGRVLERPVERRKVLMLALEDSGPFMQDRARKQGATPPTGVRIETVWPFLTDGGLGRLEDEIGLRGYGMVVIDTLSKALGRADQYDLGEMTLVMGQLQDLVRRTRVPVLIVDHHRKSAGFAADPIDDLLGSTGKAAMADVVLGLYGERGKRGFTLMATGRAIPDTELMLEWDARLWCWQLMGEAGEVRKGSVQAAILGAIRELAELGEMATTTHIAQHLALHKSAVSRELVELLRLGQVKKGEKEGREQPYLLVEGDAVGDGAGEGMPGGRRGG